MTYQQENGTKSKDLIVEGDVSESHIYSASWVQEEHTVKIEDLRGKEDSVTLDTAGFQFSKKGAKHESFADDDVIKTEYYPESIELIKKVTGASRIVLFDHSQSIFSKSLLLNY